MTHYRNPVLLRERSTVLGTCRNRGFLGVGHMPNTDDSSGFGGEVGVYIPCVRTFTEGDLHRPLRTVVVHCTGGRGVEGEWKGSGGYYTQYVPVLEFPYSVRTQGQNHHVSVNCGASS